MMTLYGNVKTEIARWTQRKRFHDNGSNNALTEAPLRVGRISLNYGGESRAKVKASYLL